MTDTTDRELLEHTVAAPRGMEMAIDAALDLHPITIRLPKELIERYKEVAKERGLIYQPLMRQALVEWIAAASLAKEQS